MDEHIPDLASIIKASPVFAALDAAALRDLARAARIETCKTQTLLAPRDQPLQHLRYVLSGHIEMTLSAPTGKSAMIPILAGQWANFLGCLSEKPMPHELWSSKSAQFIRLPRKIVRQHVVKSPAGLLEVVEQTAVVTRQLVGWMLGSMSAPPAKRLANLLLAISPPSETRDSNTINAMTHEQIGQLGFGTRQRAGQLLQQLEADGLIVCGKGTIRIVSRRKLAAFGAI